MSSNGAEVLKKGCWSISSVFGLLFGSGFIQLYGKEGKKKKTLFHVMMHTCIRSQKASEYSVDRYNTPFLICSHSFPPVGSLLPKLFRAS